MKNILTTIPKYRFKSWELAERVLVRCDGETDWDEVDREGTNQGRDWLWFIRTNHLPKQSLLESVCYMVFDGRVRGYFHIVDSGHCQSWVDKGYLLANKPTPYVIVLANWRTIPLSEQVPMTGFQGWRYTALRP